MSSKPEKEPKLNLTMPVLAFMVLLVALVLLADLRRPSAAEKAEGEFDMVSNNTLATRTEKCAAARRARDAWLAEGNAEKYEFWSMIAGSSCMRLAGEY